MSKRDQSEAMRRSAIGSQDIKRIAAGLGFDLCGITTADPIGRGEFYQQWLARGFAGTMGYLHRHQESRLDVRSWLPWARSVIVVALNYKQRDPAAMGDGATGKIAMYAWGKDYHNVLRDKLGALVAEMRKAAGMEFEAQVCVDTSAVIEREFGARAGIGWIGKNTLVLNQNLGSLFFLGLVITDLELEADSPSADHCGSCTRCLEACPTNAFPQPYVMDARRCISYLTIEHRGEIEPELGAQMGDWVFGCDDCQTVCPYNSKPPMTAEARFRAGGVGASRVTLDAIDSWTEQDYRQFVDGKATDRAKFHMWKRNASIVQRNQSVT